ncbi:hypothetical protein [Natronobiforma cellulositropha]|uniref:hypothetical protein n=1 Tax=Natronobiforma cellulositropha TaxID=1679076 RepID=UPI0021D58C46|nr:hypothetical protein [Natronobiforma cellulositropha]
MRRSIVIAAVVLTLAFVFVGGPSLLTSPSTSDVAPEEEETLPDVVSFDDAASGFWPYLNARESHEKRSPINVIVRGETDEVVRALAEETDGEWDELAEEHEDAEPDTYAFLAEERHHATGIEWGEAAGTTRYAWVDPGGDDDPRWVTETLQLEDGDYYGQRYHIRLYETPNPDDRWVAMQGHTEHFDWFTLRHRVDGVEAAQLRIESDFMSLPQVDNQTNVSRINLENSGPSDADGWATLVDLTALAVIPATLSLAASRGVRGRVEDRADDHLTEADRARLAAAADRLEAGHLVLAATILTLFLGVRVVGVALERGADFLTMHVIAAILYPVITLGIPIATYLIARGLERRMDAAVAASLSLAVAIWIDYGLLGVDSLPVDVVVQRILVVVALGLIAGGAAKRATRDSSLNDMVIAGVVLWALVLVGTLFGYL